MEYTTQQQPQVGGTRDQIWRVYRNNQDTGVAFEHVHKNSYRLLRNGRAQKGAHTGYGRARRVAIDMARRLAREERSKSSNTGDRR